MASDCVGVEGRLGNGDTTGLVILMGSGGCVDGGDTGFVVTGVRSKGSCAGMGCDAWVVNSFAGSKRSVGTACSFRGQIPVH